VSLFVHTVFAKFYFLNLAAGVHVKTSEARIMGSGCSCIMGGWVTYSFKGLVINCTPQLVQVIYLIRLSVFFRMIKYKTEGNT
jgi:hypothetical protein